MTDEIVFQFPAKWLIKIRPEGIFFNREAFPECDAEDFARAFVEALEDNYEVIFVRKNEK